MVGSIRESSTATTRDWHMAKPFEAGFADDLEARLGKAVADKRIWNMHAVIVIRGGRLVLERYFDGADDARGTPLGVVAFKPDTLHDLRSVSKSIVGLLYGIALRDDKVPPPEQPLMQSFPEYADLAADSGRANTAISGISDASVSRRRRIVHTGRGPGSSLSRAPWAMAGNGSMSCRGLTSWW